MRVVGRTLRWSTVADMPTVFGHAIVGAAIASAGAPAFADRTRLSVVGAICAVVPDADVVTIVFGIPYSNVFGHRGLSHSLLGAAVIAAAGTIVACRGAWNSRVFALLWAAVGSHALLDAMTNG